MYTENPCATLLEIQDRMHEIVLLANVYFRPTDNNGKYQVVFFDGQIVSFDSYTVDWQQLERTCSFWSKKVYRDRLLRRVSQSQDGKVNESVRKGVNESGFGSFYG